MKNLLIIVVTTIMLMACTKEQYPEKIIGTWEAYYFETEDNTSTKPEFDMIFTETEFLTYYYAQDITTDALRYTVEDGKLNLYNGSNTDVWDCTIRGDKMILKQEYTKIKLRRK